MRTYPVKTPALVQSLFPRYQWRRNIGSKTIYLTFDDGPTPEINPFIVETLSSYDAKATFFCVGENLVKHSKEVDRLISSGHQLANHTQKHENGWKTSLDTYVNSIESCQGQLNSYGQKNRLFRPPYGRLTRSQTSRILEMDFQIIMWDVLSGDFDPSLNPQKCLKQTLRHTSPGSIVVFHDNKKCQENLYYTLPRYMEEMHSRGFSFDSL